MIYEYELTNFKAFPASGPIPLRPITLVYGPNSSGKSSLLQSLLLLKQTIEESENPETLLLPKGNLVDLGGYREFVYRHEPERPFSVRLTQPLEQRPAQADLFSDLRQNFGIRELGLRITFGYNEDAANAVVREFAFYVDDSSVPICTFHLKPFEQRELERAGARLPFRSGLAGPVYRGAEINESHPFWRRLAEAEQQVLNRFSVGELRDTLVELKRQLKKLEKLEAAAAKAEVDPKRRRSPATRSGNTLSEKQAVKEQIQAFEHQLRMAERPIEEVVRSLAERHHRTYFSARNFLPSEADALPEIDETEVVLRSSLQRRLFFSFGHGSAAGLAARVYAQASQLLRQFLSDLVYLGPLRESPERHYVFSGNVTGQVGKTGRLVPDVLFKNRELLRRVNDQLAAFNIGYDLVITGSPTGDLNDVFSLRLVDRVTKVNASILDVGFGISQVLPVIVQSMLSSGKTLCIEQPEIHLHPRLQADLGSLLVTCTRAPYHNRFVVETHSQHLILRLQRLIRQKELRHTDVSVLYVDKDESGSRCLELRLDEDGDFIDEWPHGFFEEGYEEMFAR